MQGKGSVYQNNYFGRHYLENEHTSNVAAIVDTGNNTGLQSSLYFFLDLKLNILNLTVLHLYDKMLYILQDGSRYVYV